MSEVQATKPQPDAAPPSRKKVLFIHAFQLPTTATYGLRPASGSATKEQQMMNYEDYKDALTDVDWDIDPGPMATHGDWPVCTPSEFLIAGANRLAHVTSACSSGAYDGVVLLGGGDPGFMEALEIGAAYGVPIVSCGFAQMQIARSVSRSFSVIDISETHIARIRRLIKDYGFEGTCKSLRSVEFPLPFPPDFNQRPIHLERAAAERGERSEMLERAVEQAVAAVREDGADSLIIGCSAAYWLRAPLEMRLKAEGLDTPVLEGYRSAISMLKLLIEMKARIDIGLPGQRSMPPRRSFIRA